MIGKDEEKYYIDEMRNKKVAKKKKVYLVVIRTIYDMVPNVEIKVFDIKDKAIELFNRAVKDEQRIAKEKELVEEYDSENFTYENYLEGEAIDDSTSIYIDIQIVK